jgi:hypothetical protein
MPSAAFEYQHEHDPVEIRLAGLQYSDCARPHLLAGRPGLEYEWAGFRSVLCEIVAELRGGGRRDHEPFALSQQAEQARRGALEAQYERGRIRRLDGVDDPVNCWRDGDFTSGCMRRSRFHLATAASNASHRETSRPSAGRA